MADRETCIKAFLQVLKGVDGAIATRDYRVRQQLTADEYPVNLLEDDGNEDITNKTGDWSNVTITISIIGYVHKNDDTSTHVNNLDTLTKKTLGIDWLNTSGIMRTAGICGFRIRELVERSNSGIAPYGFYEREFDITYESRIQLGL